MSPFLGYQIPPQSKQHLFLGVGGEGKICIARGYTGLFSLLWWLELCWEHTHTEQEMELLANMNSRCLPAFQINLISLSYKMQRVPEIPAVSIFHVRRLLILESIQFGDSKSFQTQDLLLKMMRTWRSSESQRLWDSRKHRDYPLKRQCRLQAISCKVYANEALRPFIPSDHST